MQLPDFIKDRTHEFLGEGRSWFQREQSTIGIITVHHTASTQDATEDEILQTMFTHHLNTNGWAGIPYHFFYIPKKYTKGFTGKWIKLNNFEDVTWHDTHNFDSIGVCVHGYYHPDVNDTLEPEDFANIKKMLDWLCTENPEFPAAQSDVFAHRDRSSTACNGDYFYPYISEYRTKLGDVDWGSDGCTEDIIQKAGYYTEVRNIIGVTEDRFSEVSKRLQNLLSSESDYINRLEQVRRLEGQIDLLNEQIKVLGNTPSEDRKTIQALNANITKLHEAINQLGRDKGGLNDQITKLKAELKGCQSLTPEYDCIEKFIKTISDLFKSK